MPGPGRQPATPGEARSLRKEPSRQVRVSCRPGTPPRTPSPGRVHKRRGPVAAEVAKPSPRRVRPSQAAPQHSPWASDLDRRPQRCDPSFTRASPAPRPSAATAPPPPPQSPPRATPPGMKGATTGRRAGGTLETTLGAQRDGRWARTQAERCGDKPEPNWPPQPRASHPRTLSGTCPRVRWALRPSGRRGFLRKR